MLEASPYLELKLLDKTFNQSYTFLMSSDYERTMWKEAISGMVAKGLNIISALCMHGLTFTLVDSWCIASRLSSYYYALFVAPFIML